MRLYGVVLRYFSTETKLFLYLCSIKGEEEEEKSLIWVRLD
jgi:hypothetical protein